MCGAIASKNLVSFWNLLRSCEGGENTEKQNKQTRNSDIEKELAEIQNNVPHRQAIQCFGYASGFHAIAWTWFHGKGDMPDMHRVTAQVNLLQYLGSNSAMDCHAIVLMRVT